MSKTRSPYTPRRSKKPQMQPRRHESTNKILPEESRVDLQPVAFGRPQVRRPAATTGPDPLPLPASVVTPELRQQDPLSAPHGRQGASMQRHPHHRFPAPPRRSTISNNNCRTSRPKHNLYEPLSRALVRRAARVVARSFAQATTRPQVSERPTPTVDADKPCPWLVVQQRIVAQAERHRYGD